MPYIKNDKGQRDEIDNSDIDSVNIKSSGELNYAIHKLIERYFIYKTQVRKNSKDIRYQDFSLVKGVLKDVSDELTRRLQIPYEDEKIKENGDISLYRRYSDESK